jgi:hypothetical protein
MTNWDCGCMPKVPKFHIWKSGSFRGQSMSTFCFLKIVKIEFKNKHHRLFFPKDGMIVQKK